MKKFLAILLSLVMVLSLAACGGGGGDTTPPADSNNSQPAGDQNGGDAPETKTVKVGLICIGDENDQGYTYNFIRGKEAATEALAAKGITVDWVVKWNVREDVSCEDANIELADEGCDLIINNSFGFEPFMLKVAPDYPEIEFIACTNQASWGDNLDNTHNAFANIYEGRYLAGVVAGMKLQQMIDEGEITADQAVIGYVGAFSFAEVVSGFTSYFLGARSVCPSVTMKVQFVGSWSDATEEANAASALADMISVAPEASLIGTRINWAPYFEYAIESVANGESFDQDWCHGMDMDAVVMTDLNEAIAAPGTAEKLAEVEAKLRSGELQVFDTSTFTIGGAKLETAFALDTDGDFAPDSEEAVFDGAFHESHFQSAPYFNLPIDGIQRLNEEFG